MAAITYMEATLDHAALAADVMTASYPAFAQDPVLTRYRWEHPRRDYSYGRYIAERDGLPIAYCAWVHGPWEKLPERHCEVEVWLDRAELDRVVLEPLWGWVEEKAIAEGSGLLMAYCGEDEQEMLDSLAARGYHRERLEKVWQLDLKEHGGRLVREAEQARMEMSASGIEFVTLASWQDPDRLQKLHELDSITRQDIPTSVPILSEAIDDFERRTRSPDRRPEGSWIALDGDRPVAMSYLKFPPVRGTVWTGYTCCHLEYRGRGIAKAVKLQSLAHAVELGVPVVCTDNDSKNAPMLHINDALGYVRRPGFVEHHKRVTNTRA
ncbi:MAG: GNAT family N-acetyltransferase [Candidatus Dormiibacterota bacterium]